MVGMDPVAVVGSKQKAEFLAKQWGLPRDQVIARPWRAGESFSQYRGH
jgi:hypothetical protein